MALERRDVARLTDMLRHARLARELMGSKTLDELKADTMAQLAVVRCIEVIGEAGNQVSEPVKAAMTTLPWHQMKAMRNRLIHDYGNTDFQVVHDVVRADLPMLIGEVEAFLVKHGC